jgi:hypothetical protein
VSPLWLVWGGEDDCFAGGAETVLAFTWVEAATVHRIKNARKPPRNIVKNKIA